MPHSKVTARNILAPIKDRDRQELLGLTDLVGDAWGRQKIVSDYSLFQALWTFEVPSTIWLEYVNGVESPITNFTSFNGMLSAVGANGVTRLLRSRRSPRYQTNRGHLFSTSVILPTGANSSVYRFGMYNDHSGVFFKMTNGQLFACRRTLIGTTITTIEELIQTPEGFDFTKGNLYDIQMQWRGVGNIYFYINQQLIHTMKLLGTLVNVSISIPSLPVSFEIIGTGTMYSGCVDLASEGGGQSVRQRGTVDSGEISLSAIEVPVLLVFIPNTITYNTNSIMNSRDVALRRMSAFCDVNSTLKVYTTRTATKFTGTTFSNYDTLGTIKYAVNGQIVLDNLTTNISRVLTRRLPANISIDINNPDDQYGEFYITHGDYILVTMQAKNVALGGVSIEWGQDT